MIYEIIFSVLLFIDNVYFNYSSNMLSISQVMYLKYAEEIGGAIIYLLILFLLWHIANKPQNGEKVRRIVRNKKKRKILMGLICTVLVLCITYGKIDKAVWGMKSKHYSKTTQVAMGSIYGYHVFDIYNELNKKNTTRYKKYDDMIKDYEYLKNYNNEKFEKNEEMYNIAKRKECNYITT